MRKTKILATLGPTCNDVEIMKDMIRTGMDAARINFSHGTHESHGEIIKRLKEARETLGVPVPLVLDTKGPEIRVKNIKEGGVFLKRNSVFTLTTRDVDGDEELVSVTYEDLPMDVGVGSKILLDDGLIELAVQSVADTDIKCQVINEGFLASKKGVNVPDVYVNLPSLTEQDVNDLKFGIEMGVDYVAASFVRSANDVLNIREVLAGNNGEKIRIIAKIESRDGVDNIDSILEVSDGIMVARGDLGVEIPPEEVPMVQKNLIRRANLLGKLVITATQMLESMTKNPRPTRAEANDVANAIFEGTDIVMLSGETANGLYPIETISMMDRIAKRAESSIEYFNDSEIAQSRKKNFTNAISYAACATAKDINAACIVAVTDSGFAANMVARSRPVSPILALTTSEQVCRQLNLTWGCKPMLVDSISGNDEVFEVVEEMALKSGLAKTGDSVVAIAGVPIGLSGATNTIKIRIVGNVLAKGEIHNGRGKVNGIARVFKALEETDHFFELGDILVATITSNDMMQYIKKASALVVGSWEHVDNSHAETVARALDIPLLVSNEKVVDIIGDGTAVCLDCVQGFVFNGYR